MNTYFGFAIADGMFAPSATVSRQPLTVDEVKEKISAGGVIPALNPFHAATIAAMRERFNISIEIPDKPPRITLNAGDRVIVMSVRGLPRLTDRHEYTDEEIAGASFSFGIWEVIA